MKNDLAVSKTAVQFGKAGATIGSKTRDIKAARHTIRRVLLQTIDVCYYQGLYRQPQTDLKALHDELLESRKMDLSRQVATPPRDCLARIEKILYLVVDPTTERSKPLSAISTRFQVEVHIPLQHSRQESRNATIDPKV